MDLVDALSVRPAADYQGRI